MYDQKNRLLASATNSYSKTHPYQAALAQKAGQPEKVYLHAEIAALVKCRGKPYKIVVERYNREGELRLAKPCPICMMAIKEAGIKRVEYSL